MPYSNGVKPVVLPPGRARLATTQRQPGDDAQEHNRDGAAHLLQRRHILAARGHNEVRREHDEFLRMSAHNVAIADATKSPVELDIAPFGPAQLLQRLPQHCIDGLEVRVGLKGARNHADAPHPLGLLRVRRERPRRYRTAEQRDEFAAPHRITSLRRGGPQLR